MTLSPLPPLATLPASTYPPSSYPPPSHFEAASVVHPVLVVPSKRTGQVQSALDGLVFSERKRKRVYPPDEGVEFTAADVRVGYDPRRERKLVLARRGPSDDDDDDDAEEGAKYHSADDSADLRAAKNDRVWREPRVRSMLEAALGDDAETASATAPAGKCSLRPSYIRLPATPYALSTVDEALRRILPTPERADAAPADPEAATPVEEIPSSFEIAGHVAHVNLRDEALPYKYLIGKAILDKNQPKIRIVVNKIGAIENEFRTFPMEILAGDGFDAELVERLCAGGAAAPAAGAEAADNARTAKEDAAALPGQRVQLRLGPQHRQLMQVEVKEHGCRFRLDFARVYWNSRLQGEHAALVAHLVAAATAAADRAAAAGRAPADCVVADAMAGVGPFAVPLASANAPHYGGAARIVCHANDLNPVSFEYLRTNARGNRCFADRLLLYNLDARAFILKMNEERVEVDHFIMNLPQLAPEFLDAFRGWHFRDADDAGPMIHLHCFGEKARTPEEVVRAERQIRTRCATALGVDPARFTDEFALRVVRDVGPRKHMFRVSFRLPRAAGGAERRALAAPASGGRADEALAAERDGTTREGKREAVPGGDEGDAADATAPLSKRSKVDENAKDENM